MTADRTAAARARVEYLREQIRHHDYLYYVRATPEISDEAYDELYSELRHLEGEYPDLATPDSPTQRVGATPLEAFRTVEHAAPMLSLDSDPSTEAVGRFDERLRRLLGTETVRYVVEPKLDGASVELTYVAGRLIRAATRGDGYRGEEITDNVRTIPSVPLRLREESVETPPLLAVRGEVIIPIAAFEKLNEGLVANGREAFSNPRNAAAGALRQLDPRLAAERPLEVLTYRILAGDEGIETQWAALQRLADWGLPVSDLPRRVDGIDQVMVYHADLAERRDSLDFEIDGVVVKLDDLAAQRLLGATSHHPRWAFACKFEPRREITRVLDIVPSVGRTGIVTPVALLRPVDIAGVTVSRATLHNRQEVARKDIRAGDTVRVQRAGDVIPQVVERIPEAGRPRGDAFAMPPVCPSCGTVLTERGPFTVCPNHLSCPAQLAGRLAHFGSRHALDIEGLGEETARALVDKGLVTTLPDLFDLDQEAVASLPGFAEKSASNLVAAIAAAGEVDLDRFLYGLGIPEVGRATARDLAAHFGSIEALRNADEESLAAVPGIGPTVAEQIATFFRQREHAAALDSLLNRVRVSRARPAASELAGLKFVLTGALESMSRSQAKALIEAHGGRVVSSVSGATDYVVVGANPGSKAARAADLGVPILDEAAFLRLLRGRGIVLDISLS